MIGTDDQLLHPPIAREGAVVEDGLRDADSMQTLKRSRVRL